MSVSFVQTRNNTVSGGTSVTVTPSSTPTAGNLIVLHIGVYTPASITSITGETFTLAASTSTSGYPGSFLYYAVSTGATSYTVNFSVAEYAVAHSCEYSTTEGGWNFDQGADNRDTRNASVSSGSITPSADTRLHVYSGAIDSRDTFSSYGSSFVERGDVYSVLHGTFIADKILTSAGSAVTPTCTASSAESWSALHATFEEVSSGQTILTLRNQGY